MQHKILYRFYFSTFYNIIYSSPPLIIFEYCFWRIKKKKKKMIAWDIFNDCADKDSLEHWPKCENAVWKLKIKEMVILSCLPQITIIMRPLPFWLLSVACGEDRRHMMSPDDCHLIPLVVKSICCLHQK